MDRTYITVLVGLFLLQTVECQQCPYGWTGYGVTCYRFMTSDIMTWQDARDFCQVHGGDLAKFNAASDMNYVFGRLKYIQQHNHIPATNWWTGLTDREQINTWEWAVDGTKAGTFLQWARNRPNQTTNEIRCGEIVQMNKINDEHCSNKNRFICSRNRGIPLNCDADHGWQTLNGQCYKVFNAKRNFNAAMSVCNHQGGSLAVITGTNDNIAIHDFAFNLKQPVWIGLSSLKTGATSQVWQWVNGTQLSTAFWNGAPRIDRAHLNNTCVVMSNSRPTATSWNPSACTTARAFVCQKPEGVCAPGWIGHRTFCYQLNVQYRQTFQQSTRFCQNEGSELLRITISSDQAFIQSYLRLMKDSGVPNFWIGASDNNVDAGPFKWRNGQAVGKYQRWANSNHQPTNTPKKQDCAYINTNDRNALWRTTTSCTANRAFICRLPMGRAVKVVPRTPRPHYGCPANWRLHGTNCYYKTDRAFDWVGAQTYCKGRYSGSDLVKIDSSDIQGFVNSLTTPTGKYWIGLNDRTTEGTFTWSDGSAFTTYTNWATRQPNKANVNNCGMLNGRKWSTVTCNNRLKPVCQKPANAIFPSTVATTPGTDWTLKCGIGWESNPVTNFCYKFVDTPLSWADARNDCKHSRHADLVSIESFTEQNYITGRMKQMTSVAVWTGANDLSAEGGWKWIDKKPFAFFNWAQGQPSWDKGQSTDCVAMFTQSGFWDDTNCRQRNGYICEKPGSLPTSPPPTVVTRKAPAGMVLGCPPGWLPFGDNCFLVRNNPITWQNAEKACGYSGGKLASINSAAEQTFILAHLPKAKLSWDGLWIGMNDIQSENSFVWADGSPVSYTHWNRKEPNSFFNHAEDCVEIRIANGGWNDESCQSRRPGFICKRPKQFVSSTQSPDQADCPLGSKGYGPYCYKQSYGVLKNFTQANAWCKNVLNGSLVTINDRYLNAFVTTQLFYRRGYFWIGLSDRKTAGSLLWATGEPVLYTNWGQNHTGNERSTCVVMRTQTPAGVWENHPCNEKNNFICQYPRKNHTPVVITQTPPPSGSCPTGWTANWDKCYQVIQGTSVQKTWMDAVTYCNTFPGGDLASFHNYHNDSFIPQLLNPLKVTKVWIGLNDRDVEGGHKWSDGSPVDYTNWNPNEPNNYKGQENCVTFNVNGNGGGWNDQTCYWPLAFVCAIPRGTALSGVSVPPTVIGSPQCGTDPNWNFYNNYCYWVSPKGGATSTMNYYDAENYCHTLSATLASIHNETENNNVLAMTHKTPGMDGFWIGLNQLASAGLKWTDGTPLNYKKFFPNQPDDYLGAEDCVEFRSGYSGEWNDDHCTMSKRFICKKPTGGVAPISTPPPYPKGGCKSNFIRAAGGRNKCFYMGGAQTPMNYSSAVAFCNSQGPGYDLASIENIYEQEFMMTMARSSRTGIWIGMSDKRINNQFMWHDNHPARFFNWDRNEPSSSNRKTNGGNQDCVMVRMYKGHEGRWADAPCSQKLRFLCEAKQDPNIGILQPPANCPSGYSFYNNGCYAAKGTPKNWNDAQADCQMDKANLVSVLDVFEAAYVGTLTAPIRKSYWIGLSDTVTRGIYKWKDGNRILYSNWAYQEPSYDTKGIAGANGCVFAKRWNSKWNDSDCSMTLPYVCKINKGPVLPPTQPPTGSCPIGMAYNTSCYYLSINHGRSWPEARYLCKGKGMDLVSIHSKDEMDHVFGLVQQAKVTNPSYKPNIWVGLSKGQGGAYAWSDGTPLNFLYWTPGEPTNLGSHGEEQQCIEFDRTLETWNDVHCFTNRGFVCKGPQYVPTAPPASTSGANVGIGTFGPAGTLPPYVVQTDNPGVRPGSGNSERPNIKYPNGNQGSKGNQQTSGTAQQLTNTQTTNKTNGMSSGAIAGVVLGTIVVLVAAAFLLIYLKRNKMIKTPSFTPDTSSGFDNALYSKDNDAVRIDSDA